jgi:hypothetical protein
MKNKMIRAAKKAAYYFGFPPKQGSPLFSERRNYRYQMTMAWAY